MPTPRVRWRRRLGMALYYTWTIRTRIGRRGAALLVIGLVMALRGIGYIRDPPLPRDTEIASYKFLVEMMPFSSWGWIWIFVGLLAVVQAFAVRKDWYAFAAIQGLSIMWTIGKAIAYFELGGNRWVGPLSWLLVVFWVQIIAGWPEFHGMTKSWRR